MEDQIIGAVIIVAALALIGISTNSKRRWGENSDDAKYRRKR